MNRGPVLTAAVLAALLPLAGCGGSSSSGRTAAQGELSGDLVVLAAASLTGTFTELGDTFMAEHPDVTVTFGFGGSPGLAEQIVSGAPADVFAAASPTTMATVVYADLAAREPTVFTRNLLQLVVPAGNPADVTGLQDLTDPDLTVALCAPEVPCGSAAEKVFAAAGVPRRPRTPSSGTSRPSSAQGPAGRGRRRPGVPHRRPRGRRRRRGGRRPGGRVPQRLPAGGARRGAAPARASVRRPRAVAGRPGRAHRCRLPDPGELGLPPFLLAPAALAVAFLLLPLLALLVRTPWGSVTTDLADPAVLQSLRLSLVCASLATVVCIVLGVPLAWVLARATFPGRRVLRALVTVPLVLPPVVGGVALLLLLGRRGVLGQYLDLWFGLRLPFTTAAVVVAEAFVALPFLVIAVEGALRGADRRFEDAAATLGASRARCSGG